MKIRIKIYKFTFFFKGGGTLDSFLPEMPY